MSRAHSRPRRPELETLPVRDEARPTTTTLPMRPPAKPEAPFATGGVVPGPAAFRVDGGCIPSSIRVALIDDDRVFLTGGVLAGMKDGDVYKVNSGEVTILDPETREELGRTGSVSLHLRVRHAAERFSECEVLSRRGTVQVGDVAEPVKADRPK